MGTTITKKKHKKKKHSGVKPQKSKSLRFIVKDIKSGKVRYLTRDQKKYEDDFGKKAKHFNGKVTKQFKDHTKKELHRRSGMDKIGFYKDWTDHGPFIKIFKGRDEIGTYGFEYNGETRLELASNDRYIRQDYDMVDDFIDEKEVKRKLKKYLNRHPLYEYKNIRRFRGKEFEFLERFDSEGQAERLQNELRKAYDIGSRKIWYKGKWLLYVNKIEMDYHNHPDPAIFNQKENAVLRKKSDKFFKNVV